MTDFAAARRMMVDCQVRTSNVTDLRIITAMQEVPRERFVPSARADLAYLDLDVWVSAPGATERRLLKPMVLAKLIQAADVGAEDHVLDLGCATGYSSAILARLARSVVALEEDPALARAAADNLQAFGVSNVTVVTGRLQAGWPAAAPFDAIVLNGASEVMPKALFRQLREGGRLVGIVGRRPATKAMRYVSVGTEFGGRPIFDAAAALLPGFAEPRTFVF